MITCAASPAGCPDASVILSGRPVPVPRVVDLDVRREADEGPLAEGTPDGVKGRIHGQREGHDEDGEAEDGREPEDGPCEPQKLPANVPPCVEREREDDGHVNWISDDH